MMRNLLLPILAALLFATSAVVVRSHRPEAPKIHFDDVPRLSPNLVRVPLDRVLPDACVALFGPGPCQTHGAAPTMGWTDAVAGPPPAGWQRETG